MQIKTCNAKNNSNLFSFVQNVVAHWSYTVLIPYTYTLLITYELLIVAVLTNLRMRKCNKQTNNPFPKKIQVENFIYAKSILKIPSPKECKTSQQNIMFSKPREKKWRK